MGLSLLQKNSLKSHLVQKKMASQIVTLLFLFGIISIWAAEWTHEGNGPANWIGVCQTGRSQSPIDIPSINLQQETEKPFIFHGYDSSALRKKGTLFNAGGHTLQLNAGSYLANTAPSVSQGGLPGHYTFAQFHFHWGSKDSQGSEHTIDGKSYPLELHLVHFKSDYGKTLTQALTSSNPIKNDTLAVLGIMFQVEEFDNPTIDKLVKNFDKIKFKGDETTLRAPFDLKDLLPRNTDGFYRYAGSLTTPGCNEVVVWTVFKTPVGISSRQLEKFRELYTGKKGSNKNMVDNFRPVQNLNDRIILDIDTSQKKFSSATAGASTYSTFTMVSVFIISLLPKML